MTSDKRVEPRYEVSAKVPASWSGRASPLECAASDISKHGIFLEMDAPPPVETLIQIGPFDAPVKGRVVFSLAAADAANIGRKPGVGVQLDTAIDPDTFLLKCAEAHATMQALLESGALLPAAPVRPAPAVTRKRVAPPGSSDGFSPAPTTGPGSARDSQRGMRAVSEPVTELVTDVVLVDGVAGQAALAQALISDDYTPLVAKHGLEALVLCVRRRPLLCIVDARAARLTGAQLLAEVGRRPELVNVTVVLVDESDAPDPVDATASHVRWRGGPSDVDKARRLIDAAMGNQRAATRTRGPDDARVLAEHIADIARRFGIDGAVDQAVDAARYAAELAPTIASHTLFVARILLTSPDQKQRDEAATLVERVARQDPRSPEAFLLRAVVLDQRGRRDEARAALKRTLMFSPTDPEALASLEALDAGKPLVEIRDTTDSNATSSIAGEDKSKRSGRFSISKLFRR